MMNMESRNQYLKEVRKEYLKALKKEKSVILNEAERRTCLNRKTLIKKLKAKSNIDVERYEKRKKPRYYNNEVRAVLERLWKIFDFPCSKRLKPNLTIEMLNRLRLLGEIDCNYETTSKLLKISTPSIDRLLQHAREEEKVHQKRKKKSNPLLFEKILTKTSSECERNMLGIIQMDHVEHCGSSKGGGYVCTLSTTDVCSGWFEAEAMMGTGQERTFAGVKRIRKRMPFKWKEMHPDNGTGFINDMLYRYSVEEKLSFTRSRPYKKNDNCWIEQKNRTHVRKVIGILRYDTRKELDAINDLYRNELRLYKNFFCPCMKLVSKERINGKMYKRYDQPKTPYNRIMESKEVSDEVKARLKAEYDSLNPAELKRKIDKKIHNLYSVYRGKKVKVKIKNKTVSVSF